MSGRNHFEPALFALFLWGFVAVSYAQDVPPAALGDFQVDVRVAASNDPVTPAASPLATVKAFALKNSRADAAARIIEQLFTRTGLEELAVSIAVEERTNSLIVRGDSSTLAEIEALLMRLDEADSPQPARDASSRTTLPGGPKPQSWKSFGTNAQDNQRDFSFYSGVAGPSVDELRKSYEQLEQESRELAEQLRQPLPDLGTGDRWKNKLRQTVLEAFTARQKLQRAELAEFARRLRGIQQSIEMREKISEQIIDRRLDELLDPNLNWDLPPAKTTLEMKPDGGSGEGVSDDDSFWQLLGARFTVIGKEHLKDERYRGGLKITGLRVGGPAARAGLRVGDILVGIHKWETTSLANLDYAWRESMNEESVKFYVLRDAAGGRETLFGHVQWESLGNVPGGAASTIPIKLTLPREFRIHWPGAMERGPTTASLRIPADRDSSMRVDQISGHHRLDVTINVEPIAEPKTREHLARIGELPISITEEILTRLHAEPVVGMAAWYQPGRDPPQVFWVDRDITVSEFSVTEPQAIVIATVRLSARRPIPAPINDVSELYGSWRRIATRHTSTAWPGERTGFANNGFLTISDKGWSRTIRDGWSQQSTLEGELFMEAEYELERSPQAVGLTRQPPRPNRSVQHCLVELDGTTLTTASRFPPNSPDDDYPATFDDQSLLIEEYQRVGAVVGQSDVDSRQIEISLGQLTPLDFVRDGMTRYVFDRDEYVGRIRIERASDYTSYAQVFVEDPAHRVKPGQQVVRDLDEAQWNDFLWKVLGVRLQREPADAPEGQVDGLKVTAIRDDGPAAPTGLRVGDLVTACSHGPTESVSGLAKGLTKPLQPNARDDQHRAVSVTVKRNGIISLVIQADAHWFRAASADEAASLYPELQGTWMCTKTESNVGPQRKVTERPSIPAMIIRGNRMITDRLTHQSEVTLVYDASKSPPTMQLINEAGTRLVENRIVAIDGDTMRTAMFMDNRRWSEYPRSFDEPSLMHMTWRRVSYNEDPPARAIGTQGTDPAGLGSLLSKLDQTMEAIRNLSVTTDYVKREAFLLPFDSPIEMRFTARSTIASDGRSRVDTSGQQLNIEPDGKSIRTYNGRWVRVFNEGVARSLTWYEGNLSSASIDNVMSWHGIDPREFTTHFQHKPITEILRSRGAEIAERTKWDGRPVTVVETAPRGDGEEKRRYRFWIDTERGIVVRRAISVRFQEGRPWQEYSRIECRDHREIVPGIWLPMQVKYESLEVTPDLVPEKVSWRYEGTSRDWQVNQDLPAETFDLKFPDGIQVNDHRPRPSSSAEKN